MTIAFTDLVEMAARRDEAFQALSRNDCVTAARNYARERRQAVRQCHYEGSSGTDVVRQLAATADAMLRGVFDFGLCYAPNPRQVLSQVSLCALGGYGRGELCPYSDLDVCLLCDGEVSDHVKTLNSYLLPFLWDLGFHVGYTIRTVSEAMALAREDVQVYTSFLEGRLIAGDNTAFARLKLFMRDWPSAGRSNAFIHLRVRERHDGLPEEYRDLYRPDPNGKESAGGLRDLHTALWLLMLTYGARTLDDVVDQGFISTEEHLGLLEAQDFIWRIRNELHYHAGRAEDRLTIENQQHVAEAFGYWTDKEGRAAGRPSADGIARFMQDYYAAAQRLRRFLHTAVGLCDRRAVQGIADAGEPPVPDYTIRDGQLYVGLSDEHWFAENPVRFMEVFWECARYKARLSPPTERLVIHNVHLIGDMFRSSDVVRRFFVAICGRPLQAGYALRQMAHTGVLARYIPEFGAVQGVIRYADFHHYPVDEHTLRAIEALAEAPNMSGPVAQCLLQTLEDLYAPHVLVLAILFHDTGKAESEVHVAEGVRLARQFCRRTGMMPDDEERIAFLVQHHLLMTEISQYRDVDQEDIVRSFADTVKTSDRLRALFLLSYCDLAAVGPDVWNEWKGMLLLKLYLRTERILEGGAETAGDAFLTSPKADEIRACARKDLRNAVEEHLRDLGERYLAAFTPKEIALHLECVAEARETGLSVHASTDEVGGMTRIVVSTLDRPGLFSEIAGGLVAQLVDINNAALFTRKDGYVVDCFVVAEASRRRPLTRNELAGVERVLEAVLIRGENVQHYVEQSRRRLFALLQPRVPVPTRIDFDNVSSRTHTVIDIQTGDRTGLLYDITRALTELGADISTARIVTDVRYVRDSFYVTINGERVLSENQQAAVRERLHEAIYPRAIADDADRGDTS